ncbi:MAG TPA: DUF308 domain-containing protein, partial [Candidatus Avoscillospira avistercoris]|nr:DUF308 domain-containing protein [Candidatus Avoscillospira avistercoris]
QQAKRFYILLSSVLILLGLVVTIWPLQSLYTICCLIGGVSILFGVAKLVSYFTKDSTGLAFQFDLVMGALALVFGIILCFHPGNVLSLLQLLIGLFILIDGLLKLRTALDARRMGLNRWWSVLAAALLSAAAGLLLIFNPFAGARALMTLLGITLIIEGVQNLFVVIYTTRHFRQGPDDLDIVYEE